MGASNRGAELLALVLAEPQRDENRLVYADWLLERGDPRGEFIMLQFKGERDGLTHEEKSRHDALLADYTTAWLSPLTPVIDLRSVAFRKGFLARCAARFSFPEQKSKWLRNPMWATVEQLAIDPATDLELLSQQGLRSLWSVGPIHADRLNALGGAPSVERVRELRLEVPDATSSDWLVHNVVRYVRCFPNVRRMVFLHHDACWYGDEDLLPADYRNLVLEYSAAELEEVVFYKRLMLPYWRWSEFELPRPDLSAWLNLAKRGRIARYTFIPYHGWRFTLAREDAGWTLAIDWNTSAGTVDLRALHLALAPIASDAFCKISARIIGDERPDHVDCLNDALARFTRSTRVQVWCNPG